MTTDKTTNGSNLGLNLGLNIWGEQSAAEPTSWEAPPAESEEAPPVARNGGRIRLSGLILISTILVGFVIGAVIANFQKPKYMAVTPVELHEAETAPEGSGESVDQGAVEEPKKKVAEHKKKHHQGEVRGDRKNRSSSHNRKKAAAVAVAAGVTDPGTTEGGGGTDTRRTGDRTGSGSGDGGATNDPSPSPTPTHGPSEEGETQGKSDEAKGHNKPSKDDKGGH